jgi:carbon-monoxide dehydrogenase medium subunit
MIPRFALLRPTSLADALLAFHSARGEAGYLAGGTELLQVMKMGLAQYDVLIDLKGLPELRGVAPTADGGLRLGAAVTHHEIERSADVARACPALGGLAHGVANVRVRNTGTIGGNLAFAEPHSDPATLLLACDAHVSIAGEAGARHLAIGEFLVGPLETALRPGEILTAVEIPPRARGVGLAYEKIAFFERPAASVGVRLVVGDGVIAAATVALGSLTDTPVLHGAAAAALVGAPARQGHLDEPIAAAGDALATVDAVADLNGSADYKRHLAAVLLERAVSRALDEALADG